MAALAQRKSIHRGLSKRNAASVRPYTIVAIRGGDIPKAGHNQQGKQSDPHPPEVQKDFQISVVRLVRTPPV